LLEEWWAFGFGAERGAGEENFANLEIRIVDEADVFFLGDDLAKEIFALFEKAHALGLIAAFLAELLAAECGEG